MVCIFRLHIATHFADTLSTLMMLLLQQQNRNLTKLYCIFKFIIIKQIRVQPHVPNVLTASFNTTVNPCLNLSLTLETSFNCC